LLILKDSRVAEETVLIQSLSLHEKACFPFEETGFFVYKPEKGKQLERVGRKATGLHP
jgi:hypothetical protein